MQKPKLGEKKLSYMKMMFRPGFIERVLWSFARNLSNISSTTSVAFCSWANFNGIRYRFWSTHLLSTDTIEQLFIPMLNLRIKDIWGKNPLCLLNLKLHFYASCLTVLTHVQIFIPSRNVLQYHLKTPVSRLDQSAKNRSPALIAEGSLMRHMPWPWSFSGHERSALLPKAWYSPSSVSIGYQLSIGRRRRDQETDFSRQCHTQQLAHGEFRSWRIEG